MPSDKQSLPKSTSNSTESVVYFFHLSKDTISQKSTHAMQNISSKLQVKPRIELQNLSKNSSRIDFPQTQRSANSKGYQSFSPKSSKPIILTQEQIHRLKQINKRKIELMEELKKVDNNLANRNGYLDQSRQSVIVMKPEEKANKSSNKVRHEDAYNVAKHSKAFDLITKINNQKIKRHEKIAETIKQKQEIQMQKIIQHEQNLSKSFQLKKFLNHSFGQKNGSHKTQLLKNNCLISNEMSLDKRLNKNRNQSEIQEIEQNYDNQNS